LAQEQKAKEYNRKKIFLEIAETIWLIIFLIWLMYGGWAVAIRNFLASLSSSTWVLNGLYIIVFLLLIKVVILPLSYYSSYRIEHRYGLSRESFSAWMVDEMKELALSIGFGLLIGETVYALMARFPYLWWLIASLILNVALIILTKLAPVVLMPIFFRFKRLEDKELEARLIRLTDQAHTRISGVFEMSLGQKTKAANAALAGIGSTRRIILSDTLLEGYNHDEIETILAHELGHHVYNHMWKGILIQSLLITLLFFLIAHSLGKGVLWFHLKGIDDIAGLPYLTLITTLFSLIFLPLVNLYLRSLEYKADHYGVSITGKRDSFISALEKLARQNLCDQEPNPVVEFLFYSHPSISKRIGRLLVNG